MLSDIIDLINYIGALHKEFSEKFFKGHDPYNFRKITINKIVYEEAYDIKFISLLVEYIDAITTFQLTKSFFSNNPKIDTRFRGKSRESALNKLYFYRFNDTNLNIPIQRSLNDLLGFRMIIDANIDYESLLNDIKTADNLNVKLFRPYVRNDDKYHAIHIYFKSDNNKFFPWELQIWKKDDEIGNEHAHKNHKDKRGYINWSEIYSKNLNRGV